MMDIHNPVIKLCIEGTRYEFKGKKNAACKLYSQAWETAKDDYEACIAAHYMARCMDSPEGIFYWNQLALDRANAVKDDRAKDFYPSLYLNLGRSCELLGDDVRAKKYYDLAAELGFPHQRD